MSPVTKPDITRMPASITEIRGLLTTDEDRELFERELASARFLDREAFADLLEDWGMYAIGLHDEGWQRYLTLKSEGRLDEVETIPADVAHRQLGVTF